MMRLSDLVISLPVKRDGSYSAAVAAVRRHCFGYDGRKDPPSITVSEFRQWLNNGKAQREIRNLGIKGVAIWKDIIDGLDMQQPQRPAAIREHITLALEAEVGDRATAERLASVVVRALEGE